MDALWWILLIIVAIPLLAGIANIRRRQAKRNRELERIRSRLAEKEKQQENKPD